MKTKFFSTVMALTTAMSATVANATVDCGVGAASRKQEVRLPGEGYWMQAVDDHRITYTSHGGVQSKLFDFTAGLQPITRNYDAFPIPPGDIYVHPTGGYSFFKMGDGEMAQPIFRDQDPFAVYQSIGLLPGTTGPDYRVVRIAAGWGAGVFQDYKITKNADGTYSFEKVHAGPVSVCRNIPSGGLDAQIPVLSRDGTMIAGRDFNDQLTKIYKINVIPGERQASCDLVQTIPTETSKISFSFDNKKVAFVIADPNTSKGRLMEMDIATGTLTTMSLPSEDVLFMTYRYDQNDSTFRSDDRLMYTRRVGSTSGDAPSDLILISPDAVVREGDPKTASLEALGYLWGQACNMELDTDYARAAGSRITKDMCDDLIDDAHIQALPTEYRSLSKTSLKAICRREERANPALPLEEILAPALESFTQSAPVVPVAETKKDLKEESKVDSREESGKNQ